MPEREIRIGRRAATLAAAVVVAVVAAGFPYYVMRPFRAQGAQELSLALAVLRWSPLLAAACAIVGVWAAIPIWRRAGAVAGRIARRAAAGAGLLVIGLAALGTRVRVFERMFAPMSSPQLVGADGAQVGPDDMVLAARVGGARRAYPVRTIAYHHVLNDVIDGVPVVATF
jgi:hypothetical protein